jgi:dephospho-CoA kinase
MSQHFPPSPVIGIVGGIGSGKSLVAGELLKHGGYLIAGDRLGHEALRQPDIKAQLVARWGKQVLDSTGEIDRRRVAAIVFSDPAQRQALEALTHPYIEQRICEEIVKAGNRSDVRLIVLDAAILLEAGWHGNCSHVLLVDSPREMRLRRVREQRGWTAADVENRENAQMPLEEKRRHADAVITNSAGPEAVAVQVRQLLHTWNLS